MLAHLPKAQYSSSAYPFGLKFLLICKLHAVLVPFSIIKLQQEIRAKHGVFSTFSVEERTSVC